MRCELIQLARNETNENPVELDDYSSGSYAVYRAHNFSLKTLVYFRPDEQRLTEPRCDYILTDENCPDIATRFIELKGGDKERKQRCCRTEWDHAFHQLFCTFGAFKEYLDLHEERITFVLCTSIEKKRIAARFKNYKWYKKLQENAGEEIRILYRDDYDTI